MEDFLAKLLDSATLARVLRVFALTPDEAFPVGIVAKRASVSAKVAGREIRVLERMKILKKGTITITLANSSNKKVKAKQKENAWQMNQDFKHAQALSRFVREVSPVPHTAIVNALKRSGRLAVVVLSGSFVGDPSRPADLIVVADSLSEKRLAEVVRSIEPKIGWEIRYASFTLPEFRYRLTTQDRLIRDTVEYPHLILLDREGLLAS